MNNQLMGLLGEAGKAYIKLGFEIGESLGCLDFLHGHKGTIADTGKRPGWCLIVEMRHKVEIDWQEAKVTLSDGRVVKLGKWLKKTAKHDEDMAYWLTAWLHAIETREGLKYNWVITTDPEEVLGMSYERAWTSCMRPEGAYQEGPLADYEAGSALILFYRPGADKPCGREVLRPGVTKDTHKPVILRGGIIYGNGTKIPAKDICKEIPVLSAKIKNFFVLCKDVYCDICRDGLWQYQDEIKEAKKELELAFKDLNINANYPKSASLINNIVMSKKKKNKNDKKIKKIKVKSLNRDNTTNCGRAINGRYDGCRAAKLIDMKATQIIKENNRKKFDHLLYKYGRRSVDIAIRLIDLYDIYLQNQADSSKACCLLNKYRAPRNVYCPPKTTEGWNYREKLFDNYVDIMKLHDCKFIPRYYSQLSWEDRDILAAAIMECSKALLVEKLSNYVESIMKEHKEKYYEKNKSTKINREYLEVNRPKGRLQLRVPQNRDNDEKLPF